MVMRMQLQWQLNFIYLPTAFFCAVLFNPAEVQHASQPNDAGAPQVNAVVGKNRGIEQADDGSCSWIFIKETSDDVKPGGDSDAVDC